MGKVLSRAIAMFFVMVLLALPLFGASVALVAVVWVAVSVLTLYSLSSRRNRYATQPDAAQVFRQRNATLQSSKSAVHNHGPCGLAAAPRARTSRSQSASQQVHSRNDVWSNPTHAYAVLASHIQNLLLGHRPRDQSYGFQIRCLSNRIGHYRESTGLCPG